MGLFSKEPKIENNRANRKKCWESRDKFFSCLDKNDILKPSDGVSKCKAENQQYETDCVSSWVKYFNEKRIVDFKREQMLKQVEEQNAKLSK
ncbi:uncharacterized protein GVI51_K07161 [Nakaseomyces glabratus]|uniref:Cytochrome c oxidase assembly factor 6 n=2 Tax=Candida glabrata TaxID=5478 RepID=Q6FMK4_CANGA|nr:uncharacterized protein CAGL0K07315g [Nakaseomyces glabratus]KAH7582314.1 Cytochrome oxidase c subunit VIb [Nakaseomyces glabratus]KAH7583222.1 Cytochrome oxidase c subunit VIb [Nakaseomyces glabratus]KAH7584645.1 Cytochrome oxidase c subunit VIb [Nakaseomyces glabratus]KAH7596246.1 Cytochrome oxidase c subunit VIb [Nakaseomyces glabratus]KAH7597103.1 Cytochrome oxidase c subunit VIb [Nakaseomyces glabratus]|eukprot:XP_448540.1 uncharacterized protein CAGL0K07315g [[Candida] glabrata]